MFIIDNYRWEKLSIFPIPSGNERLAKSKELKWHAIFAKDLSTVLAAGRIRENDPSQMGGEAEWCIEHAGHYFEKDGSEKIDIETDITDSE